MSPFKKPIVLDNDVISRLFSAQALRRALEIWPKHTFHVTDRVLDEARQWRAKGQELEAILRDLESKGIIIFICIDESSEAEVAMYAQLRLGQALGQGESSSIAIAQCRDMDIATDDSIARQVCRTMAPSVSIFGTGDLLNAAVREGIMTQKEKNLIQETMRSLGNP